ncbi:MAG: hypothetical protein H0W64_12730 [Gammaproteobacteria bacterium]|nr:hypothetical protein [Gammaproteobacteria bacterium]
MITGIKYSDDGAIEFKLLTIENIILHVCLDSQNNYYPALLKVNEMIIVDGDPIVKKIIDSIEYWLDSQDPITIGKIGKVMFGIELDDTIEDAKVIIALSKVLILRNYILCHYVK